MIWLFVLACVEESEPLVDAERAETPVNVSGAWSGAWIYRGGSGGPSSYEHGAVEFHVLLDQTGDQLSGSSTRLDMGGTRLVQLLKGKDKSLMALAGEVDGTTITWTSPERDDTFGSRARTKRITATLEDGELRGTFDDVWDLGGEEARYWGDIHLWRVSEPSASNALLAAPL